MPALTATPSTLCATASTFLTMNDQSLIISLNKNEALVLFEFLARFNQKADESLFEDQAEQKVLVNLEASLEKHLSEPFQSNYTVLVNKARQEVRDKE